MSQVTCVEKRGTLGGTCLNVGCIPSKALLNASHMYHDAEHSFASKGINIEGLSLDWDKMQESKVLNATCAASRALCPACPGPSPRVSVTPHRSQSVTGIVSHTRTETHAHRHSHCFSFLVSQDKAVSGLTMGIEGLFKKNKVDYVKGHGRISGPNEITVDLMDGGTQTLTAKNIIIASG